MDFTIEYWKLPGHLPLIQSKSVWHVDLAWLQDGRLLYACFFFGFSSRQLDRFEKSGVFQKEEDPGGGREAFAVIIEQRLEIFVEDDAKLVSTNGGTQQLDGLQWIIQWIIWGYPNPHAPWCWQGDFQSIFVGKYSIHGAYGKWLCPNSQNLWKLET